MTGFLYLAGRLVLNSMSVCPLWNSENENDVGNSKLITFSDNNKLISDNKVEIKDEE